MNAWAPQKFHLKQESRPMVGFIMQIKNPTFFFRFISVMVGQTHVNVGEKIGGLEFSYVESRKQAEQFAFICGLQQTSWPIFAVDPSLASSDRGFKVFLAVFFFYLIGIYLLLRFWAIKTFYCHWSLRFTPDALTAGPIVFFTRRPLWGHFRTVFGDPSSLEPIYKQVKKKVIVLAFMDFIW